MQAGPGTIAEAMIRGLPIILNGYIAGQVTKARRPFTRLISITKKKKTMTRLVCVCRKQGMFRMLYKMDVGSSQSLQNR